MSTTPTHPVVGVVAGLQAAGIVPDAKYLRPADLMRRWQVGRTTIWRLARDGELRPVKLLGGRALFYPLADVQAFEAARAAARPAQQTDPVAGAVSNLSE